MSGFDNETVYANGLDLTGNTVVVNQLATDGFLYIGNASGNPVAGLLTSSDSTITWTAGSGTLSAQVDITNIPTVVTSVGTDSGTATPSSNALTISGGTGLNTSASGSTITITLETPITVARGGTGTTAFATGSVIFMGTTTLTQDTSNLFWDNNNNRLGIGTTTPIHDLEVQGHVGIEHTALAADAHALEIVATADGFGDFKAIDIDYITGALSAGEEDAVILVNIDETLAGGGEIFALEVLSTTEGTDTVGGLKVGIGVDAIHQESGTFGNIDNVINIAVDVTAAVASGGAGNITMFVADNDTITMGDAAIWDETEVIIDTPASGGGIAPVYAFSTGGSGFTNFVPVDGTNGFKNTGIIDWDSGDLSGWATNASGRFEIRITRTRNSLSTSPIVDTLQLGAATEFMWDAEGNVNLNGLTLVTDLAVAHGGTGTSNFSRLRPGYVENLGIDYNGGTGVFTVQGASAALSATNSAFVCIQSSSDLGNLILYEITANQSFIDDVGVSEIIDNLFSVVTGVAYGNDLPFFLYAVTNNDEDAIAFMISRIPHATISPAAASIGAPDDAVADTQGSFWSLDNIDETLFDANPCLCIGSFRMVMSSSDDWTVQAINSNDGIGHFNDSTQFTIPTGAFGAASSTLILANGGTSAVFSTNDNFWYIKKDGTCMYYIGLNTDGGTDGSGSVTSLLVIPFLGPSELNASYIGQGETTTSSAILQTHFQIQTAQNVGLRYPTSATAAAFILNSNFGNGARSVRGGMVYEVKRGA